MNEGLSTSTGLHTLMRATVPCATCDKNLTVLAQNRQVLHRSKQATWQKFNTAVSYWQGYVKQEAGD